jgi:hypothetical protein
MIARSCAYYLSKSIRTVCRSSCAQFDESIAPATTAASSPTDESPRSRCSRSTKAMAHRVACSRLPEVQLGGGSPRRGRRASHHGYHEARSDGDQNGTNPAGSITSATWTKWVNYLPIDAELTGRSDCRCRRCRQHSPRRTRCQWCWPKSCCPHSWCWHRATTRRLRLISRYFVE